MTYQIEDKSVTLMSLHTTTMTTFELFDRIEQMRSEASWSDYEFYIDGDSECVCAKPRVIA